MCIRDRDRRCRIFEVEQVEQFAAALNSFPLRDVMNRRGEIEEFGPRETVVEVELLGEHADSALDFDRLAPCLELANSCLLYTSDAADDLTRVDLGGRR